METNPNFSFAAPATLGEALDLLNRQNNVSILAGGTDLIPLIKYGVAKPDGLLSLEQIGALKSIEADGSSISIGSMVTLDELVDHPLINQHFPCLSSSARAVGSPQIRAIATIGGNILQERRCLYYNQSSFWRENVPPCLKMGGDVCHQAPKSKICLAPYYSDLAPVLLVFDAMAEIFDHRGFRLISVQDLIHQHIAGFQGNYILTRLIMADPAPGTWAKFIKSSVREAIDFPTVNLALRCSPPGEKNAGRPELKIVIGAMAAEPIALRDTEEYFLENLSSSADFYAETIRIALEEVVTKRVLVKETAISIAAKKNSSKIIGQALGELFLTLGKSGKTAPRETLAD